MLTSIAVWAARLIVGGTFVVSGLAKMIDLYGSVNKFNDYFAAWGLTDAFPEGLTVLAAAALAMAEFLTGFTLATGSMRRTSALCAAAIMAFMLPLSAYIWAANPVSDCGCFGDWLIISNRATFWKNVLLSALCVFLLLRNRRAGCLFAPWVQWMQIAVAAAFCGLIGLIGYDEQPLLDFRPYPVGSMLYDPAADSAETDLVYLYRRVADGATLSFPLDSLPDDDSGLEFVDVITREQPAADRNLFAILDPASGLDITDSVVGAEPLQLFLLIPDLHAAGLSSSYSANELAARLPLVALTDAPLDEIDRWRDLSMADYPVYLADSRTLKTVARGKTALLLARRGEILWKRTLQSVDPAAPDLAAAYSTPSGPDRFRQYLLLFLSLEAALALLGPLPTLLTPRKKTGGCAALACL